MICEFGCNQEAKFQLKNGKWCCCKSQNSCLNIKDKNRKSNLGKRRSDEIKERMKYRKRGTGMKLRKHNQDTIQLFKNTRKGKNNPRFGVTLSEETKQKIRSSSLRFKGKNNPMYGKHHSEETKRKIGLKSKEKFFNNDFLNKYHDSINRKPNKKEDFLLNMLKELKIYNMKYVGDGSYWVDGKNPDFIDLEKSKIIEFFGDYYHGEEFRKKEHLDFSNNDEHSKKRIDHFRKNGFECLVIWENEINNIHILKETILEFYRS